MLYVEVDNSELGETIEEVFSRYFKKEWLNNSFVKRIIKEMEQREDCGENSFSRNTKTLIILYQKPEEKLVIRDGSCMPLLLEISRVKDVTVRISGVFDKECLPHYLEVTFLKNNKVVTRRKDFVKELEEELSEVS